MLTLRVHHEPLNNNYALKMPVRCRISIVLLQMSFLYCAISGYESEESITDEVHK